MRKMYINKVEQHLKASEMKTGDEVDIVNSQEAYSWGNVTKKTASTITIRRPYMHTDPNSEITYIGLEVIELSVLSNFVYTVNRPK